VWCVAYVVRVVLVAREGFSLGGFTGTVVESLVLRLTDPSLHGARPKPFSVTPLFLKGRPVVDLAVVGPGNLLEFRVGFAGEGLARGFVERLLGGGVELFGRRVEVAEVEMRDVWLDPLPGERCFKLEFLTPTRFATPPLYRRRRALFDFLPRPLTLFKSAVRHGRALGLVKLGAPFLRWVYTYVALTDVGCWCRKRGSADKGRNYCSCVRTVKLPNGGVARGFVGWALYRVYGRRRLADVWKTIRLMEAFNVGTGRGMGLGVVRATPLPCPGEKAKDGGQQ